MPENFVSRLDATARRVPRNVALLWDGGALTYAELDGLARGFAAALARGGARPGDTVALSMPNGWPFAVALLGAWKAGTVVAPLDVRLSPDEEAAILADLRPARVVRGVERHAGEWPTAPAPGPEALVLYTSGSTGAPKGAVLSHDGLAFAVDSWAGPVMALTPADVVLAALPLAHSLGLNGALLAPLLAGAAVALVDRFSPEAARDAIARHGVTVFPGVATMFRRLLDLPGFSSAHCSSLRLAVSGAAPCPWALAEAWRARTGVRVLRGYGMTELFRPVSYLAADAVDVPDAVGRAVPGVELAVVDETRRPLPHGEAGELWIKTPAAMLGYLNAAEETGAVLADGWFRTGDLAVLAPDGLVRIVGRRRERILRGGDSVFPQEVEAALLGHPDVLEAAVVGVPHPELGEEVAAFVALRAGARVGAAELIAYAKSRLAGFKYPRHVRIVAALPRSATGKILKGRLTGTGSPG